MLPQPAPNASLPPPSKAAIRSRRKWRSLWITGVLAILILAGMAFVKIRQQRIKASTLEATSNLRSIHYALTEFETAYGAYPNENTRLDVMKDTGAVIPSGTKSSNDYFRQLIAAEICQSETLFYADIPGTHKPDNIHTGSRMLEKGEVGYSYIVGLTSAGDPKRPLVVTPLIPGTNRFDPKPFNGYAIILPADESVSRSGPPVPINKNGEVIDSSGKHVLDPENPMWGGMPPVIAWPE